KLTASNPFVDDDFGFSVGISGDTAVIGAPDGRFPPVAGTAYVFVRSGSVWSQQQKLTASAPAAGDGFSAGVGISGDTAVIGASGAAYVFVRSGSVWSQQQKLTANDPAVGDRFGGSVGISGDMAVIGASGAAYGFVRGGRGGIQQQKVIGSDPAEQVGSRVGLSGAPAVVGT